MSQTLFLKDSVPFISIDGKEYEVINPEVVSPKMTNYADAPKGLFSPVEWSGGVELIEQYKSLADELQMKPWKTYTPGIDQRQIVKRTVARLLPKEKKEPTPLHDLQTVMNAPVESQEDMWEEVLKYCDQHFINDIRVKEYLSRRFSLTRNPLNQ